MTKEELNKEAEAFTDSKNSFWQQGRTCVDSVKQAYIAGAEPREKQLTKAKDIIKILLKYDRGQFFDNRRIYEQYMHTRVEAEQFIKDSEVEK